MNKLALALGTFDGLHRGHINVLNETKKLVESGFTPSVLLFDCHPQKAISGISPPLLITNEDKENFVREMGLNPVPVSFGDIRDLSPEEFVRDILIEKLGAGAVVSGENFRFGKNGCGDSKVLCTLCEKYGIIYKTAESVTFDGELISATRIRNALKNGDIERVNAMLGRNFSYDFLVVEGNKIGKKFFGFPTINQRFPADFIDLKHGVYASQTLVDGELFPSVTNFGNHPTVGETEVQSETCILGFDGDLYYRRIRVELLSFLRSEKKFNSAEELRAQIDIDSKKAAELFSGNK
ncbi:MAG: riboflavin biosynthesis protein RibF [Oscillospiraceae bacterium]|nr:riboflavin biosynthesis protein RibF [Oscillospiraceae bacterium]